MSNHTSRGQADSANLLDIIEDLRHYLPQQGPMEEFVHHNTLHAFQHFSFFEGVMAASRKFGSYFLAPQTFYGEALNKALPNAKLWAWVSNRHGWTGNLEETSKLLYDPKLSQRRFSTQNLRKLRNDIVAFHDEERLIRFMIRLGGSYLDQGVALSNMPEKEQGLWKSLQCVQQNSLFSIFPSSRKFTLDYLRLSSEDACKKLLEEIVGDPKLYHPYILEILLSLPGWAGMISMVEKNPELMRKSFNPKLMDWLAVFLLFEFCLLKKSTAGREFPVIKDILKTREYPNLQPPNYSMGFAALHEYIEWSQYSDYVRVFSEQRDQALPRKSAKAQLIFCIDDREISLRRFIEEQDEEILTFGAPGFFGVDFFTINRSRSIERRFKMAPVPAAPKINIFTQYKKPIVAQPISAWSLNVWPLVSWLEAIFLGLPKAAALIYGVFFPTLQHPRRAEEESRLVPERVITPISDLGKSNSLADAGFSIQNAASKLESFFKLIGLTGNFAKIVGIIGHGGSSVNNPYFSAYDCGACSGKSGSLNAHVFCTLANNDQVRRELSARGITIPDETLFVPLIHDTTCDVIDLVESDSSKRMSREQNEAVQSISMSLQKALARNALWRCRQFDVKNASNSGKVALQHVRGRAAAWFQPRPEYNHATNIGCYIGNRQVWKDFPKERTLFLHSYLPESDPTGSILAGALNAVIPVCGGINLEYFFSAMDPEVYGASSKLAQNVSGMMGVVTGLESDLRTGLPRQMTEIHDPYRLLILIDQEPEIVKSALAQLKHHTTWVDNQWLWVVSKGKEDQKTFVHTMDGFSEISFLGKT